LETSSSFFILIKKEVNCIKILSLNGLLKSERMLTALKNKICLTQAEENNFNERIMSW
jgi:hypothetical protein